MRSFFVRDRQESSISAYLLSGILICEKYKINMLGPLKFISMIMVGMSFLEGRKHLNFMQKTEYF